MLPRIPSVERVVASPDAQRLFPIYARTAIVDVVRSVLDDLRRRIRGGQVAPDAADGGGDSPAESELTVARVVDAAEAALERLARPSVISVVNATGVVLHTNLGRATLAPQVMADVERVGVGACALEYDVAAGRRGDRDSLVEQHVCALTGAEAATVVNNNAAAVLLVLNSLAEGREVVVSRGELVEIGGSFRIPDVMTKSGARLREVGTTNRTHPADYERAVGPETAMLLKVHTSNYRIVGFTSAVELDALQTIAAGHEGLVVAEDLGAGALVDLARWGLPAEPVVADRLTAGADLVTFSGDKLLGGPQCGLIAGRADLIERIRRNPLKRALRCDKMTLAALESTLRVYRFDPEPERVIPTLRALVRPIDELERIGEEVVTALRSKLEPDHDIRLERVSAQTGSGSQPEVAIDSVAVAITSTSRTPHAVAARFRRAMPPTIGRIEKDRFLLDLRTIDRAEQLLPDFS